MIINMIINKYMMATKALHKLGDINSDEYDLCFISSEDDENYIGNWITGLGFIGVKFPKETTRDLTQDEIKKYNSMYTRIGRQPPQKLNITD